MSAIRNSQFAIRYLPLAAGICVASAVVGVGLATNSGAVNSLTFAIPSTVSCRNAETVQVTVPVRNEESGSVQILGARTSCSCVAVSGLPMKLKPGEAGSFEITFQNTPPLDEFVARVDVFCDTSVRSSMIRFVQ